MSDKLILTNQTRLKAKYGTGFGAIQSALNKLIASDAVRGIKTLVVAIDDSKVMSKYGGKAVLNAGSFKQNKDAVDAVCKSAKPDYLVLLGATDVIPHQDIKNPLFGAADPDQFAWGDIPYACEAPYGSNPKDFIGPTRVLGRIPDVVAGSDPQYLVKLLATAAQWKSRSVDDYANYLGISAEVWKASTSLSLKNTFGTAAALELSPASGPSWTASQLSCLFHFINCHGSPSVPHFYGQKGGSYPCAHSASLVSGHVGDGTVASVECCYGAELYDPAQAAGQMGICNTYLESGAYGFLGSTTIAYGPATGNSAADLICQYFLQSLKTGASLGRAALEARLKFVKSSPVLSPVDLKTIAQFNLLGDPSIQPVAAPVDHSVTELVIAKIAAPLKKDADAFERSSRRRELLIEGMQLSSSKLTASLQHAKDVPASIASAMRKLAGEAGIVSGTLTSFEVNQPSFQDGIKLKALVESFEAPDAFHVISGRIAPENVPGVHIGLVVGKEHNGKLVSVEKLFSR